MKTFTFKNTKGFAALITVIILSAVLLLIGSTLSLASYYSGLSSVSNESKEISHHLAMSCGDAVQYALSQDLDYGGNQTINIKQYQCTIGPITIQGGLGGGAYVVTTSATVESTTTNLNFSYDPNNLTVIDFVEL